MLSSQVYNDMYEAGAKAIEMLSSEAKNARYSDLWNGEFMLNIAMHGYRVAYVQEELMDSRFPTVEMWIAGSAKPRRVFIVPVDLVLSYERDMITKQYINY